MGLNVYSLNNIPQTENRDYFIYLLEYGWHEPIAKALNKNFYKMADRATQGRSVVIKGTQLSHFENEVFSWHQINNEKGEDILPAILISNAHPSYFKENNRGYNRNRGLYRESTDGSMKLILIPLKKFCSTTTDVISLIEKVFLDIEAGRDLAEFQIAKEVRKGIGAALVDSVILEPNISGIGFNFNKLWEYLRSQK
ncbi:hypothetical protein ACMUMS_16900 [Acinetobacter courvalinii]|uniref:hypothetical protein n=1 Tax=Acinetobacter courvalinii TaxID=280147 RepID=UPI003A8485F0